VFLHEKRGFVIRRLTVKTTLNKLGSFSGFVGILICLVAVAGRFYGEPAFLGFQAINVFIVGIAFLILACWVKLEAK
jgi:hypothetical protein